MNPNINWDRDPTPDFRDYLEMEKDDPNLWWRIGCGHHQNLFVDAVAHIEELEKTHDQPG